MSGKKQSEGEQNSAIGAEDNAQKSETNQTGADSQNDVPVELTPEQKVAELTDLLKRKQAEFVNYQNRMEAMQKEQSKFASQRLIEKLLPIVDMFDLSVAHKEQKDQFIAGMEMIHTQLGEVLESEGVTSPDLVEKPFDPALAQAVSVESRDDVDPNIVLAQHQKCYQLGGRTIRHARVVVSKKPAEE